MRASSARTSCTPMLIVRIAVAEITMAATTAVVGSDRRGLSANLHRHLAPRKASSAASTSAGCEGKELIKVGAWLSGADAECAGRANC